MLLMLLLLEDYCVDYCLTLMPPLISQWQTSKGQYHRAGCGDPAVTVL